MFLVLQPINSDIFYKKRPMLIWLHKQYCSLRKDIRNIYLSIMFFTNPLKCGMLLPFISYFTMLNITLVNKYITTQFEHFVVPICFFVRRGKIGKGVFNIREQQCLQRRMISILFQYKVTLLINLYLYFTVNHFVNL